MTLKLLFLQRLVQCWQPWKLDKRWMLTAILVARRRRSSKRLLEMVPPVWYYLFIMQVDGLIVISGLGTPPLAFGCFAQYFAASQFDSMLRWERCWLVCQTRREPMNYESELDGVALLSIAMLLATTVKIQVEILFELVCITLMVQKITTSYSWLKVQ